tara:strand:+ start:319 stop:579 length:261 start_codon:yes stop_codon:yes gene_type:complete
LKNGSHQKYCWLNQPKGGVEPPVEMKILFSDGLENGTPQSFDCLTKSKNGSSGGSMSASQEQKLRKLAEDLYDKCQLYGKSYDSRC